MKHIGIVSTAVLFAIFGFTVTAHAQDQHDDKDASPDKKQEEAKPEKQPKEEKAAKPEKQDDRGQDKQQEKQQDQHQNQDKAAKEQQKNEDKAVKDQQRQEEKTQQQNQRQEQNSQKNQVEEQQKAAQHDQQNNKDQNRDNQRVNGQQPAQQANRPSSQPQHGNAGAQQSTWQAHRATSWQSQHRTWQQRGGYNGYRIPDDRFRASFGEAHRFRIDNFPVVVVDSSPRFQINGFWFSLVDPWPETWADNWYDTDDVYIEYFDGGYYLDNSRYPGTRLAINVSIS